jgi:hypothetical protein
MRRVEGRHQTYLESSDVIDGKDYKTVWYLHRSSRIWLPLTATKGRMSVRTKGVDNTTFPMYHCHLCPDFCQKRLNHLMQQAFGSECPYATIQNVLCVGAKDQVKNKGSVITRINKAP